MNLIKKWLSVIRKINHKQEKIAELPVAEKIQFDENLPLKLATAVEQSANIIVITDTNGIIQYVNPSFIHITGYSKEDVIGQHTRILKSGKQTDDVYKDLWQTIKAGKTWKGEFCNRKKNGELYWENAIITPVKNKKLEIISYIAIKEDITLQKQLSQIVEMQQKILAESEQQLRELNTFKDKLFNIIAHDLKGPFNTLLGFSSLLADQYNILSEDKKIEYIGYIKTSSEQGLQLLINLLEWSRAQTNRIEFNPVIIQIQNQVENVFALLEATAQLKEIQLINQVEENIEVFADKDMLNTVLRNLLSNAIKFTPRHGHVIVTAGYENTMVIISVTDTGIGMDETKIAKLFKTETDISTPGTENEKGTGLGLLLCKDLITRSNGKIRAESTPGKGSTFSILLPVK